MKRVSSQLRDKLAEDTRTLKEEIMNTSVFCAYSNKTNALKYLFQNKKASTFQISM